MRSGAAARRAGGPEAYFDRLRAWMRQPREAIRAMQSRRLTRRVAHAYERIPFYRELLDRAGMRPDAIRSADDLPRLPLVEKRDLLARPLSEILARDCPPERCAVKRTGGSTGHPFEAYWHFDRALSAEPCSGPLDAHLFSEWGLPRGSRVVRFGAPVPLPGVVARSRYYTQRLYPATTTPERALAIVTDERPDAVNGYPSLLTLVAEVARARGVALPRPALVVLWSEYVEARTEDLLEDAFGVRPVAGYGAWEIGHIGWRCEPGGPYHLHEDVAVVEVLRDGEPAPPGEAGEVVATGLVNAAMPFIRYRLGDRARFADGPCRCGVTFRRLEILRGRLNLVIRPPAGPPLAAQQAVFPLRNAPGVRQYRLVQDGRASLLGLVVADERFDRHAADAAQAAIEALAPGMRVRVRRVEHIPPLPSGKQGTFVPLPDAT